MKNLHAKPYFPPLAKREDLPRPQFDFELDTKHLLADGTYFRILVMVYNESEFEIWDPDEAHQIEIFDARLKADKQEILKRVKDGVDVRRDRNERIYDEFTSPGYVDWINGGSR